MTTISIRQLAPALLLALALGGCGSRQTPPARLSPDAQFEQATAAFEAGKYSRALQFLEPFLASHLGDPRAPRARFLAGEARLERGEYILAAAEFTRLLNDYPSDPLAREARFGICRAYRELSPKPALDQEYTSAAIAHCESYAGLFPETEEARQAQEWVEELRRKLARKSYETGMFYFKRGAYDASVIYFTETVEQFPGTETAPAALLKIVEAYETIGYEEEAEEARARLLREYPQSPEAQAARQTGQGETTGA